MKLKVVWSCEIVLMLILGARRTLGEAENVDHVWCG
jgi:hypothetical protein